jgi:predicted transcriptional regulator
LTHADAAVFPSASATDGAFPRCLSRGFTYLEGHGSTFHAEQEARLAQSAAEQGRDPDELVRQVVARYCDEESRFSDAVRRGEEALERGEYLTHEQVGQRLVRFLQP